MRISKSAIFLSLFCLAAGPITTATAPVYAQSKVKSKNKKQIKLSFKNELLPQALKRLEQQSGYKIIFIYDELNGYKVSCDIQTERIEEAMKLLLEGKPLEFSVDGNFVNVSKQVSNVRRVTSGRVVFEEDGQPVVGATVRLKGSRLGTITDVNGHYVLRNIPDGAQTLLISYIGMKPLEVAAQTNMQVALKTEVNSIREVEVVATGMNTMDRRLFTGSTTKVDAEKAKIDGVPDISRSLEGRVVGVSVQNVTGTFGTAPRIQVRGATSIYGSSSPLWIVDGVIQEGIIEVNMDNLSSGNAETLLSSAIAGLNADDIESFQILRDGSATSIYGARAMAGVIVINTKKGSSGRTTLNYTGEFTSRLKPRYTEHNIMNSQEQMSVYQELEKKGYLNPADVVNASSSGVYGKLAQLIQNGTILNTDEACNEWLRLAEYRNTDWFDELFSTELLQNHSVSISTGNEKSQHYMSLSAMYDPGWYQASHVNRYTANVNSNFYITPKVRLQMQGNASVRKQKAPGTLSQETNLVTGEVSRDFDINPYSYCLNTSRVLDPAENYTRNYADFNIFDELENNYMDLNLQEFKIQGHLNLRPFSGMDINLLGAVKSNISDTEHIITENSNQANAYRAMPNTEIRDKNPYLYTDPDDSFAVPVSVLPKGGIYDNTSYRMTAWDFRATVSYNHIYANNQTVNLFGGVETNSVERRNSWMRAWGMEYGFGEIGNYTSDLFKKLKEEGTQYYSKSQRKENTAAFFATGTYAWRNEYVLNGTVRYEGTNTLGKDRKSRWLPTWNVAGAWNAHEERWFAALRPALSHATFKMSYSLTADRGPFNISNTSAIMYASLGWRPNESDQETTISISQLGNSDLTYEKKHELNITADLGFLNNTINLEANWYQRRNFDLIGPCTTQGVGGEISKYGNVADMKSGGVEFSLNATPVKTKDFSWTTTVLYSHQTNEVTNLKNTTRVIDLVRSNGFALEGYSVRSLFSIPFAGLTDEGFPTFIVGNDVVTCTDVNFQEYEDLSWLKYEGTTDPTDYGSLDNEFRYKGLRLNIFVTYSMGNVVRLDPVFHNTYSDLTAMPREFNNRWVSVGEENTTNVPVIPSVRQNFQNSGLSIAYNAYNYSTERVAKGDFVRLKEISADYTLPQKWVTPLHISNVNIKMQATNIWLIYADKKLNGNDPEFFNTGGVSSPMPRQYTLTLRVGF